MAEVAKFCRARQTLCHHATQVPQVAILFSTAAHYRKSNGLFARDLARMSGTLQALLEGQQSVELLGEHHLTGRMAEYPLIVVPEWEYLEHSFKDELVAYVKGGGNLLLIGPKTAALFQSELDAVRSDAAKRSVPAPDGQPAATITEFGRGKIAAVYSPFGQGYVTARSESSRQFLNDLVRQLFPKPLVEVKGSPDVDVVVNRLGGKLAVNLVNTAGPHQREPILDSIPSVGPLDVTIRQTAKPARVMLEPAGTPLAFEHRDGEIHLVVPRVDIHEIIVVEAN
jgi:hypothetical protein